jgi:hypothetical protein
VAAVAASILIKPLVQLQTVVVQVEHMLTLVTAPQVLLIEVEVAGVLVDDTDQIHQTAPQAVPV